MEKYVIQQWFTDVEEYLTIWTFNAKDIDYARGMFTIILSRIGNINNFYILRKVKINGQIGRTILARC